MLSKQFPHQQIPLEDKQVIFEKHASALRNHQYSEQNKSRGNPIRQAPDISIGDLVHLCNDKSKHHPRDRYIVTSISGHWCQVRKFVGSQLRSNAYKIPMNEVYRVPSPKQVQFNIAETEEDEWECQDNLSSDQENIHQTQTDHTPVPPIEQEIDIPPEISLHPDSSSTADVSEDVAVSDARPPDVRGSIYVQSSEDSAQVLRRSARDRRPKVYEGYQM